MAEAPHSPDPAGLPEAVAAPPRRFRPQLVWIIPIVAILVGGWLAVKAVLERGPTITISFKTAEGLEAGKTKIKYKDVELGVVKTITLSPDRKSIVVTAELHKEAEEFLRADTEFFVVRPRVTAGGVSGLGTLLSGGYIGMDIGKSKESRHHFVGLEVAPIITGDEPGREFRLLADDQGSHDIGTPIYYRRVQVGQVVETSLDKDGKGVSFTIFIRKPYDKYVTPNTRFWNASGIDVKQPDKVVDEYLLVFDGSVRGLSVGAPLDFRGITIGEVERIGVSINPATLEFHMPVLVKLFPERLRARHFIGGMLPQAESETVRRGRIRQLVEKGLRAQLRSGNLLTGQLYVALDIFPDAPKVKIDIARKLPEIPTIPGTFEELQETLTGIVKKLDKLQIEEIGADVRKALASADETLKGADTLLKRLDSDLIPDLRRALDSASLTLKNAENVLATGSPLQSDLLETLKELNRTLTSVRALADYLQQHPDSLLRGKPSP